MKYPSKERLQELFNYEPETGDLLRKVDRYGRPANKPCKTRSVEGYYVVMVDGTQFKQTRIIWTWLHGHVSPKKVIDHINGVKTDNRLTNLRAVSSAENSRNKVVGKNNISGYPGVNRDKAGYYAADISTDEGRLHLGYYATLVEAVAARKAAELCLGYTVRQ